MRGSIATQRTGSSVVLTDVVKRYGAIDALRGVDIEVERNTLVALLGPSGCGKSTLLRIVAGFEPPDRGRVNVGGNDVTDVPARARGIGFVAQNYALFPHMTVAQNVGFALAVSGAKRALVRARVDELLALVRLEGFGPRRPRELSGGQKQRVALARALAAEPAILLLDEPFAALDLQVRRELRTWLRELHERTHTTTILVTHDADEALELADRIVLLEDGRVAQSGSPEDLYRAPRSPFAMRFFGTVNVLHDDGHATLYVRPHDFTIDTSPFGGAFSGTVRRVAGAGRRLRIDILSDDGQQVDAELEERDADRIRPVAGQPVYFAPRRAHTFAV